MPHASTAARPQRRARTLELDHTKTRAFRRLAGWALSLGLACTAVACGDEPSGTPTSPSPSSPSTTAVTVTVKSPIRMGEWAQATGSATITGGAAQPITSGWRSDAPNVATVTDAGMVTGAANGRATIYVVSGGRQGQQVIRVLPDYQGQWAGTLRITSCTETGVLAEVGLCDALRVGATEGFDVGFAQDGETMSAKLYFGNSGSQTVSAPIDADGATAFSGSASYTEEGITLLLQTAWQVNSAQVGTLTGRVTDVFRFPGFPGEGRVSYDIVSARRTSATVSTLSTRGGRWTRVPRRFAPPVPR